MSSRADQPPRRGFEPRRGASRDLPPADEHDDDSGRGFDGIGDARAYTPRGRTVAERDQRTRSPRAGRNAEAFRPALQVLDGGQPVGRGRGRVADEPQAPARGRGRRGDDADAPVRGRRTATDDPDAPVRGRRSAADDADAPVRGRRTANDDTDGARRVSGAERRGRGHADEDHDVPVRGRRGSGERLRGGDTEDSRRRVPAGSRGRTAPRRPVDDDDDQDVPRGRPERRRTERALEAELDRAAGRERPGQRAGRTRDPEPARGRSATRTLAGGSRLRSTGGGRTEAVGRAARERRVAVAPEPRRTAGGRGTKVAPARPAGRRPEPVEPPKLANSTRRLRLGTVLALALFVAIGVRLVVMQVAESPAEAKSLIQAREQRLTEVVLPAPRGSILDRSGAVLAHSVEARYIAADPEKIKDLDQTASTLSPLLGVPISKLRQLLAKSTRPGGGQVRFVYLARGVDIPVASKIAALKLTGIIEDRDERRDVPNADLAANLIGFTGEDHTGLEGLEARYDDLLRGNDGELVYEIGNPNVDKGQLAKEIPGGYRSERAAQPGTSLELTIDRDLQFNVQRFLSEDMKRVDATIGAAVVLDVKTGEVLSQASYPAYNAAKPFDAKPIDREDVASSVIADPGSSHKAFTIGAALQEGVITPDSSITVGPALSRGGYLFNDSHPQPKGTKLTIPGVLAYSSNVGTIRIADMLGKQKLYEYQQKFGLGKATGEGMPGEATGRLLAPDEWSASASGSVPIGMSVDATLIQMAAGYGAIANDGVYIQPHLIRSTIDSTGHVTAAPAPETHRVLSPNVAQELRTMMEAVVDVKEATGTQAAVPGFRVAGKTGTGKRLVDGQYTRYNAGSFIGMAPAENPRFVIAVFADVPNGTGGDVAAPAFSKMMSDALHRYLVPPSGTKPPKFKIHP